MYQYRIYVGCNTPSGDAHAPDVVESVGLRACPFDGCTVQHVTGVWRGEKEDTVVFEYVGDLQARHAVRLWAGQMKTDFSQEAVLVTRVVVAGYFA